jgi:GMP synthase (glutamine-hydrolysing)
MAQPTLLVLTHGSNDRLGRALAPLQDAGLALDIRHGDIPSSLEEYAGLLVMGGPGAAFEDSDEFPSRVSEVHLVADALEAGLPTLGICLGAQLIAHAAGAWGYEDILESGWFPVQVTESAWNYDPLLCLIDGLTVMQNHSRHYSLPPGAEVLARGTMYPYQAFRVGNAWGFQFHLEADEDMSFPQGMEDAHAFQRIAPVAHTVFTRFASLVVAHGSK